MTQEPNNMNEIQLLHHVCDKIKMYCNYDIAHYNAIVQVIHGMNEERYHAYHDTNGNPRNY